MKLHHLAFEVSDLAASLRFYADVFGMKVAFQETDPVHGEAFAILSFEGGALELVQRLGGARPFRPPELGPPYCPHLAFETGDLDGTLRALTERGARLAGGPFDGGKGIRWVYLADPDHNVLELIQLG